MQANVQMELWNAIEEPLDYRMVSTPDTTWMLISVFDMNHVDGGPLIDISYV